MLHFTTGRMKSASLRILAFTPLALVVLLCQDAWALQTHGGMEGVVVHQAAHVQYLGALGYLLWDIRRSGFAGVGWLYLQRFCWLMMIWNGIAFIGHFAQMGLSDAAISTDDGYLSALLLPETFGRWVYYVTAFDHLVITPALFLLFLAMRSLYKSVAADQPEDRR